MSQIKIGDRVLTSDGDGEVVAGERDDGCFKVRVWTARRHMQVEVWCHKVEPLPPKPINLTPHAVRIYSNDGQRLLLEIPPSGRICRVKTAERTDKGILWMDGVQIPLVSEQVFTDEVEGLPDDPMIPIIVGTIGLESVIHRHHGPVYVPDTGPQGAVRNAKGDILGVKRLIAVRTICA